MTEVRDLGLARKVRETVKDLMNTHRKEVGFSSSSTKELVLVLGNKIVTVEDYSHGLDVTLTIQGKNGYASVQVDGNGGSNEVRIDSDRLFTSWSKTEIQAFLGGLAKYKAFIGLNHPYGYVIDDRVGVIFVRVAYNTGVHQFNLFIRDGVKLPKMILFSRSATSEAWNNRFRQLVGTGNVVPLREGKAAESWWEVGFPVPTPLKTDGVMTSHTNLLEGGTYRHIGSMFVQ